ncbi:hypothetical protein FOA52_001496 [Chlamydomonas sp. UWO 241]|nr:hypothetical protein FOA52_001496 [Chlamydomonas sp. UWO 241]
MIPAGAGHRVHAPHTPGAPASGGLDSPYEGGASTPPWSPRFDAVAAHMAAAASKTAPMAPSIVAVHSVRLQAPSFCRPRNTPSPGPRLLSAFPESPAPAPAPAARAPCYQRQSSCRSLRPASQLATPMPAQRASSLSSHNWFQPETTVELSPHSATAELAPAWDERELHGPKHGTRALAAEQAQQSAALFAAHAARRQAPEAGAEPAGAPGGRPSSGRRSGAPDATHVASYTPSTAEAVSTSAARVTTGASGRAARSLLPGQQQQQQQQQPGASAHASHRQPPPQQRASVGVSNPAYSPHPAQPHAPPASSSSSSGAFTAAPGALVSGQFGGGSPSSARTRPAAPASKFHPTKVYTSETTDRVLVARTAV